MAQIQWKQISPYLSGSGNLTGSLNLFGDQTVSGDLSVGGRITAQEFFTEFTSASVLYESGSTLFGNSSDDTHVFTGSASITGSLNLFGPLTIEGDQENTGSFRLELDGVTDYFSVNVNGVSQIKVNEEGTFQLASKDTPPTAVTGGLFYSSSNEYYLGFI